MTPSRREIAQLFARRAAFLSPDPIWQEASLVASAASSDSDEGGAPLHVRSNDLFSLSATAFRVDGCKLIATDGKKSLLFDLPVDVAERATHIHFDYGLGSRLERFFATQGGIHVEVPAVDRSSWFDLMGDRVEPAANGAWPTFFDAGIERALCPPVHGVGVEIAAKKNKPFQTLGKNDPYLLVSIPGLPISRDTAISVDGDWLAIPTSCPDAPPIVHLHLSAILLPHLSGFLVEGKAKILVETYRGAHGLFVGPLPLP